MRKRCRRRPVAIMLDPLNMLQPAPQAARQAVMARFQSALLQMTAGEPPGPHEWRDLADAINTVETLTQLGHLQADEVMPTVQAAIAGMVAASKRYRSGARMGFDGPGLQAVRECVAIYGDCLEGLTGREMAQARAVTEQRIQQLQHRQHEGDLVVEL